MLTFSAAKRFQSILPTSRILQRLDSTHSHPTGQVELGTLDLFTPEVEKSEVKPGMLLRLQLS